MREQHVPKHRNEAQLRPRGIASTVALRIIDGWRHVSVARPGNRAIHTLRTCRPRSAWAPHLHSQQDRHAPAGIPLGSTEIATPGISPVDPSQNAGMTTCAGSDGAGPSAALFDGGGLAAAPHSPAPTAGLFRRPFPRLRRSDASEFHSAQPNSAVPGSVRQRLRPVQICRTAQVRRPSPAIPEAMLHGGNRTMKRSIIIALVAIVVAALAGGGFWYLRQVRPAAAAVPVPAAAVPVVAATVNGKDVPIYLRGIGTVIAYNTDVVRSQIQGQTRPDHLHRRTDRQGRRSARADRSAPLSGPDRTADRQSRPRPGPAHECPSQSLAL